MTTCPPIPPPRGPAPDRPCKAHPPPSTIAGTMWCRLCGAWRPAADYPLEYAADLEIGRRYVIAGGCYYCGIFESKATRAVAIFHDPRGCFQVCAEHFAWRKTQSQFVGTPMLHSRCCPEAGSPVVRVYNLYGKGEGT